MYQFGNNEILRNKSDNFKYGKVFLLDFGTKAGLSEAIKKNAKKIKARINPEKTGA